MKDLYTFDESHQDAMKTYDEVTKTYVEFFKDLGIDFYRTQASSGSMGGDISHEYHVASENGEDEVVACIQCSYQQTPEYAERHDAFRGIKVEMSMPRNSLMDHSPTDMFSQISQVSCEDFLGCDGRTLIIAVVPSIPDKRKVNVHRLKKLFSINTSIEKPRSSFHENLFKARDSDVQEFQVIYALDRRVSPTSSAPQLVFEDHQASRKLHVDVAIKSTQSDLTNIIDGDECDRCGQTLFVKKTVELGHTFHLGNRYSAALGAVVATSAANMGGEDAKAPLQMGCHGIGLSRLIPVVADTLRTSSGLRWPPFIAPFQVVIIPKGGDLSGAKTIYDLLSKEPNSVDCIIDDRDRKRHPLPSKLTDTELLGIPIRILVGHDWNSMRSCKIEYLHPVRNPDHATAADIKEKVQKMLNPPELPNTKD